MTARLSISLLGTLEARLDNQPLSGFEYNKVRALLAYLAVESGQPHSRESLCNLLWPDLAGNAARQNLSQALSQLRKMLGDKDASPPILLATNESVQLHAAASEVDVILFSELLAEAEAHPHRAWRLCSTCAEKLRRAIDLYRGDFLVQFYLSDSAPFEEWALLRRERLRQYMLSALERLAAYAEWRGAFEQAIQMIRRQVELEPLSDDCQRELMRLLALSGQKAAAILQYETLQRTLKAELDLQPEPETTSLYEKIRRGSTPEALRRFQAPKMSLPAPPTGFIGREADLAAVKTMLMEGARLLTITGAPGVGKTRLALEAAHQLGFDFEDGARFIELAPVADADQAPSALAQALEVKEQPGQTLEHTLQAYLRPRHILLALDNFEHLMEAAPFLAGLLASAPEVKLLVTSRAALHLRAEQQYSLAPMFETEAMQMFSACAQAAQPGFQISAQNRSTVAALCKHLDNLPLGIELVAVRVRTFSPGELLQQLEQRQEARGGIARDLPERQSSLRNAIAWSFQRLAEDERRLFARLGVFAGGCTAEAAQAVAGSQPLVLEALVENSLVQTQSVAGETRFTLLETIREYALEQLDEMGETELTRRRHAEFFATVSEMTRGRVANELQNEWYARLSADLDNLRAALRWTSEQGDYHTMLRICAPFHHFWWQRGLQKEGLRWLEMAMTHRAEAPLALQAEGLVNAGVLALQQDDYTKAETYLQDGLLAARQIDHQKLVRGSLANLGYLALVQGKFDQVEAYLVEAIKVARAIHTEEYARFTLTVLADLHYRQGQFAAAQDSYTQALQINQQVHDDEGIADCLWGLARSARGLGDLDQAEQYCAQAMEIYLQMDHEQGAGWVFNVRADIAHQQGQEAQALALYRRALDIRLKYDDKQGCTRVLDLAAAALAGLERWSESAQIMGAADAARQAMGGRMTEYERQARDTTLSLCRDALGVGTWQSAWEAGRSLTLQQAVALVQ